MWFGLVLLGIVLLGVVRYVAVWFGVVRCGGGWCGVDSCGVVWCGVVRYCVGLLTCMYYSQFSQLIFFSDLLFGNVVGLAPACPTGVTGHYCLGTGVIPAKFDIWQQWFYSC